MSSLRWSRRLVSIFRVRFSGLGLEFGAKPAAAASPGAAGEGRGEGALASDSPSSAVVIMRLIHDLQEFIDP